MKMSLKQVTGLSLVLLVVNAAYIWSFAAPTVFYMGNVALHLAIGLLCCGAGALLLTRDSEVRRSPSVLLGSLAMAVSLGLAAYLWYLGNLLEFGWVLRAHIIASVVAVVALLPYAWGLARQAMGGERTFGRAFQFAAVALAVVPLSMNAWNKAHPNPDDRIVNPLTAPISMEGEGAGPQSPFFPSSANTNVNGIIPSNFFMDSEKCGECHKDVYEQWKGSMHHMASFNNQFYRKSIEHMQSVVGTKPSKWCAGCHDHAVFFNGRFDKPIKEQIDTPEAQAGLACTSCHAITQVSSTMGNGSFRIEYPPLHELMSSKNPVIRKVDRFMTYLNPEPHRRTFMKPFMKLDQSAYCSACHKVHLDVPVNSYRWFRGFNEYDNWQSSGFGEGARSFYYPPKGQTCVDCHMAATKSADPGRHTDGTVHNHRFAAANTAVPFINHDKAQQIEVETFLKSGFISVDIFAAQPIDEKAEGTKMVRRMGDTPQAQTSFGVGEESMQSGPVFIREVGQVAAPINKAQPQLMPGSSARLDVVVRTRKIGHFFPGGVVDAFDIWLEVQGKDADGKVVFWSGQTTEGEGIGPVEPGAHFYKSYQLDADGNPINKRNAWQTRSVMYVRLIPPGAADVAHYRVRIPKDAKGPITFTAKLNYRKFTDYYTKFVFAGEPKPGQDPSLVGAAFDNREYTFDAKDIPKNISSTAFKDQIPHLPIIVLAETKAQLPIGDGKTPTKWTPIAEKADRERWNDWGIGLLLQGDLKAAEYAFTQVTKAEPGYADGWLNVARALVQEGETDAAKPFVAQALKVDPSLGRIHFFKSQVEKADGDYDAALASLKIAADKYPRDRVVWNQIGRILFLQRKYDEALKALEHVARIDPEDLQMHYTAMLCYGGLGNEELVQREQKLFARFKAEEAAQAITATRRRASPEDNNERQQIHEHEGVQLGPAPAAAPGLKVASSGPKVAKPATATAAPGSYQE